MRAHRRTSAGAALALALLVVRGVALLHLFVAPHTLCLEHGDFIEGAATDDATGVVGRADAPGLTAAAGAHLHDGCLAALTDDANATAPAASTAFVVVPARAFAGLAAVPSRSSRPRIHRLAPKTSPPV